MDRFAVDIQDWKGFDKLTLEDRGKLFTAAYNLAVSGERSEPGGAADVLFDRIAEGIIAQREKQADISQKRKAAVTARWSTDKPKRRSSAPKPDASQEPEKPKQETVADKINAYTENTELRDALKAFSEMRTKQRKPLTPRAMALVLTTLDSLSRNESEKVKIVNQSIVHGWQSVYALKPDYGTQRNDVRPGLRPAKELTDEDMEREYALGALNLDLLIKD